MYSQIKDLEGIAREAQAEANTLEKRHAELVIETRNAESNLAALEDQRVRLQAELKSLADKKK
jgi:chromosome segregation ATPase